GRVAIRDRETLEQRSAEDIPGWIRITSSADSNSAQWLLCNDREHLLFYVQIGCLEFHAGCSKIKSSGSPDYLIIEVESPDYELGKAVDVVLTLKQVLDGLQLPSFVKTDGAAGLHVYVPLDSQSDVKAGRQATEYLCKLVRLKIPDMITLKGV